MVQNLEPDVNLKPHPNKILLQYECSTVNVYFCIFIAIMELAPLRKKKVFKLQFFLIAVLKSK